MITCFGAAWQHASSDINLIENEKKGEVMPSNKYVMRVTYEKGTNWITVNGSAWTHNKYPADCVDKFGDVWLKPYYDASNLYMTVDKPTLYFHIDNGCLVEN